MVYVPTFDSAKPRARSPRAPKYKNKKVEFRGMKFDSIGERDRYLCLLQDQEDGRIRNLERQVKFPLTCNGVVVCHYIADFVYRKKIYAQVEPGSVCTVPYGVHLEEGFYYVVEDFKGVLTDTFQLKAKMFKACYGFDITITKRRAWKSSNTLEGTSWKRPKSK